MFELALFSASVLLACLALEGVEGHGYLINPPARSSAWRVDSQFPAYYGDNQMFCGGVQVQYGQNDGKCGICGEAYDAPKMFEKGGSKYLGIPVRTYAAGQRVIESTVKISANHKGYIEFRLCNVDQMGEATQACLDQTILKDASGKSRFTIATGGAATIKTSLQIPSGFSCDHCVLQWKYNTGNSWGVDPDGSMGIGKGNQEQFYGCSDIKILGSRKREQSIGTRFFSEGDNDPSNEETTISKGLLKRLFNELQRLRHRGGQQDQEFIL